MLKQSASRNLRAKSLKVKHALQIFVLVAICVWFLYNLKSEKEALNIGRKQLKPRVDELEIEEVKLMMEKEGSRVEEKEEMEKEKSEEVQMEVEVEHDQMQDFIDEDDKDQLLVEAYA